MRHDYSQDYDIAYWLWRDSKHCKLTIFDIDDRYLANIIKLLQRRPNRDEQEINMLVQEQARRIREGYTED